MDDEGKFQKKKGRRSGQMSDRRGDRRERSAAFSAAIDSALLTKILGTMGIEPAEYARKLAEQKGETPIKAGETLIKGGTPIKGETPIGYDTPPPRSPILRNPAVNAPSKPKRSLTAFLGTVGIEPAEYARKLAASAAEYARKLAGQQTARTKPPKAAIGSPDAGHPAGQVHFLEEDEQESAPAPPEAIMLNTPQAVELPEDFLQCDPAARDTIEQRDQMNSMARLVQKYKTALKRSEDNVEVLMTMNTEQLASEGALRKQMVELLAGPLAFFRATTASERVAQTQPAAASAAVPHSDV